jgi:hypothetical protein
MSGTIVVDDDIATHPKFLRIQKGFERDCSVGIFVCLLGYSHRHLTDGEIPRIYLKETYVDEHQMRCVKHLIDVGILEFDVPRDVYVIHDYAEYQQTKEQVKAYKQTKSKAGKASALARAALSTPVSTPVPTDVATTINQSINQKKDTSPSATSKRQSKARFAEWWSLYPKKVEKKKAEQIWLTKLTEADELACIAATPSFPFDTSDNGKYILNPTTFLNGRRWEDEGFSKPPPRPVVAKTGDLVDCPNCTGNGWVFGADGEQVDCDPCHGTGKVMFS